MPAVSLSGVFNLQNFTDAGLPAANYRLYTLEPGTTTQKVAYTDQAGTTSHTYVSDGAGGMYIALNARGELPAPLFLQAGGYDIAIKTPSGAAVWTRRAIGSDDGSDALITDLADATDPSNGAGMVGFGWDEDYSVNTIGAAVQDGPLNIMWFLSEAEREDVKTRANTLDVTTKMALAHSYGRPVYYPAGTYRFSRLSANITSGGIIGEGQTQTILNSTDTSGNNLFTFVGALGSGIANQLTFRDFLIQGALSGSVPAKSGGAAIGIAPTSGENSYAAFNNVMIAFVPIGIDFVAASLWKIIGCNFLSYNVAGVQVANTNSADSGDSAIIGCVFNNPYTIGSGIWQKSSGGLKILGNKFLGGERAYTMALEDSTSVLIISGNSMENMAGADIALTRAVSGKAFVNVCITGNEFSVGGIAIATDSSGFLSEVNISSNQINMGATGSNPCIALNAVTDFHVDANLIKGNGGAGSSAINIVGCTNGKIGKNTYANLPNPISISTSTNVSFDKDSQSGTATSATSGWAAYGALFRSSVVTVTFPRPFLITPLAEDVSFTPNALNGEIGANLLTVSTTALTFYVTSSVTGIAASMNWRVNGVF
jgi:hypothetical protein